MILHYIKAIILKAIIINVSKINHYEVETDIIHHTNSGGQISFIQPRGVSMVGILLPKVSSTHSKKEYIRGTLLCDFTVYSDRLTIICLQVSLAV